LCNCKEALLLHAKTNEPVLSISQANVDGKLFVIDEPKFMTTASVSMIHRLLMARSKYCRLNFGVDFRAKKRGIFSEFFVTFF
jgi:hypothetical protein